MSMFLRPVVDPIPDPDWEVAPEEVRRRLEAAEPLVLVDCRTHGERSVACIDPSLHVPMHAIHEHVAALPKDSSRPIVVYCHHGVRSLRVTAELRRLGFSSVHSMVGGIDRWSTEVDPATPRY